MSSIINNTNDHGVISNDEKYMALLEDIKQNPSLVIEHVYDILDKATNGKINMPNPSHPFGYLIESSAVLAANVQRENEIRYRKQYPVLATEYKDLYNHMFDQHYLGRFSLPGRAMMNILFPLESLIDNLVDAEIEGVKQLIIPRGSTINVGAYQFTLLYPIVIKQLQHKGIQVLYDTNAKDPVQDLASNIIDWSYTTINGLEYLKIKPLMYNVSITKIEDTLIQGSSYRKIIPITTKYCHCRVYHFTTNGWQELHTTHSDLIYDATVPTARLTYLENQLDILIPSVYFTKNIIGTKVRIELYTTLGDVEEFIGEFNHEQYESQWSALDDIVKDSKYVAGLELIDDPIIFGDGLLSGGKEPESFEETRDRVINFATYTKQPITSNQLQRSLKVKNYHLVKSRDTITSRGYLAVRALPINRDDTFNVGASSAMERIKVTIEEIAKHPAVRDNERRLTITPEMLYRVLDGVVNIVYPENTPSIEKMGVDKYLDEINRLEFCYSPFYYVVDTTGHSLDLRAYYFDNPSVENITFMSNNSTSGYSVSTNKVIIYKFKENGKEGFKVRVETRSTDNYKEIPEEKLFCQLAIQPTREKQFAYINGELLGQFETTTGGQKNHVWEFTLPTDWDVNKEDNLILKDLYMIINEPRKFPIPLDCTLNFIYGIQDIEDPNHEPDAVDKLINREIIENDSLIGITHDKAECKFGDRLNNFWTNAITLQDTKQYARHEIDVPRVYKRDVYEYDENGFLVTDSEGELVVKHPAGSPVLDENDQPILEARKGDIKIDAKGVPVLLHDRKTVRTLDIMMVDGIYYFATDANDAKYRNALGKVVRDWIVDDLGDIQQVLLENTRLYYYPKRTMGDGNLIVDGGLEIQTPMRLSFKVTYYMTEESYGYTDLRDAISKTTHDEINLILQNRTVSTSDIITLLKEKAGHVVKAVDVKINGLRNGITIFTSEDDSVRCSVKRVLKSQSDKTLKVIEDIEVNFVKHDTIEELRQ